MKKLKEVFKTDKNHKNSKGEVAPYLILWGEGPNKGKVKASFKTAEERQKVYVRGKVEKQKNEQKEKTSDCYIIEGFCVKGSANIKES